jgi:homoserine acetyltransferase
MCAALTHHVTPARLSLISSVIPKVTIVTGDSDNLMAPSNSAYIKKYMEEAEYLVFEETGHSMHMQRKERYNNLLERVFSEGRERARRMTM